MATPPQVTVAFTAEDRGLSAALKTLNVQMEQLVTQQNELARSSQVAAAGEEELAASMEHSKAAAAILGEETGIKLSRHLRGLVAESELLGPALSAAFPVIAAVGFIEVISQVAEKMTEVVSDLLIYTEDQKKAYEIEVERNKELVKHRDRLEELNKQYERIGKSALQVALLNIRDLNKELGAANEELERTRQNLTAPLPEAGMWEQLKAGLGGFVTGGIGGAIGASATAGIETGLARVGAAHEKAEGDAADKAAELRNAQKIASEEEKKASKEREASNERIINSLSAQADKWTQLGEQQKTLATDVTNYWATQNQKTIADQNKTIALQTAAETKSIETRLEAEAKYRTAVGAQAEKAAVDAISLEQREVQRRAALRQISGAEEAAQLQELAQKKLDIETAYLDARLKEVSDRMLTDDADAYAKDLELYTSLQEQKSQAQTKFNSETSAALDEGARHLSVFQEAQRSIGGDITNFFTEGITQAHSFGEAFANLARSIVGDLQRMAAEFVLTAIKKKLLGDTDEGEGGGGGGGGFGGFLGGIIGALGGGHFATGGFVSGPGGPKSDSVPAMLSSGEFVMSADTVKAIGAANLDAINSGIPHLASGGFVGGDLTTNSNISMGIGLDEGLILRHLGSKAAGKVILQQLTNNPKGAQRALSRTD